MVRKYRVSFIPHGTLDPSDTFHLEGVTPRDAVRTVRPEARITGADHNLELTYWRSDDGSLIAQRVKED